MAEIEKDAKIINENKEEIKNSIEEQEELCFGATEEEIACADIEEIKEGE